MELHEIVRDFATAIKSIDDRRPQAASSRTGKPYQAGIGPHPETQVVALVATELAKLYPVRYSGRVIEAVPYPRSARQKCDLCIGVQDRWEWCIEVKMLRMMGDNGKPNDNMIAHILSPYPAHRSALTDCRKLAESAFSGRKAIVIYGFDYPDLDMDLLISAFEVLAARDVQLGERQQADFDDLCHPVHFRGRVFGWEVSPLGPSAIAP